MDRLLQTAALAALLCGAGAGAAHAACRPADLAGTWDVYLTIPPGETTEGIYLRCPARISAAGALARTDCLVLDQPPGIDISGRLTVNNACSVRGRITVGLEESGLSFHTEATMSRSKDIMIGAITEPLTVTSFAFQAVRL